MHTFISTEK